MPYTVYNGQVASILASNEDCEDCPNRTNYVYNGGEGTCDYQRCNLMSIKEALSTQ
jgi:hypothetical protein